MTGAVHGAMIPQQIDQREPIPLKYGNTFPYGTAIGAFGEGNP